jgi:diguanylate cyclase (GGDEF)-like protein/PAS domain S-box-containing protein
MSSKQNQQDLKKISAEAQSAGNRRLAAEKRLSQRSPGAAQNRTIEETLYELEVHQIELEMQNDELRRAQSIIDASRERYVDFYDFAPVGYLTLGRDATIGEINLTGASLLGEERSKLLHKRFVHFVVAEDRDRWQQHFMAALQQDKKLTSELTLQHPDGTRLQVRLDSLRLLKDEKPAEMRVAMSDITEHKRTEDALREQEEFFRMITENIEDFIAVLDLQGRRLYNSPSYAKLFSNVASMKGTDSFAEVHPDDREHVKRIFADIVQSGTGLHIEYRFVRDDGSIRHMESSGGLIRNSAGQASRIVVISRDITERKEAEEKINKLAFCDTLTLLPNRRMLDERMIHAVAASRRSGRYCALMFLDLDNFKPLNDQYGHEAGDLLLIEVARRISSCVREIDTVARFGGDEFVVMLSELDVDKEISIAQTGIVAEKIRAVLETPYTLTIKNQDNKEIKLEHHCTASIGVVMFVNHEFSPEELIKRADLEMYHAKEMGRNQVCFLKT